MTEPLQEQASRFDRLAAEWDSNPARVTLARQVARAMAARLPLGPQTALLDLGAGTGLLSLALLPHVGRVTAVDSSAEMTRVLTDKIRSRGLASIQVMHADIQSAPLPRESFDVIVSSMVLHHLPDVPAALLALRACLKPAGWIALADLDAEDGSFHPDRSGVFHNGFDRATLARWLLDAGYVEPEAGEAATLDKPGADGRLRHYSIFMITARNPYPGKEFNDTLTARHHRLRRHGKSA